ncbi:EamA family transporter RarD [Mycolicibacterium goodii]|uniref:Protein rarD n=1 Tax=Mycolicibacterium goodii TaxID=134601 RepID=A0A0K0XAM1_MYCGD|nr:protein rarD [Mycolicibacterium goodii]
MSAPNRSGVLYGASAYIWWGLCPGFFVLLLPAGALEVVAHRIVWSTVFLLLVVALARRLGDLRRMSRRTWLQLLAASALISVNWGTYIFAVTTGHVVDAALGYFINPLVSVALGVIIFRERINRWQGVSLALAIVAVAILTVEVGEPPYIAVVLAVSFGVYGLVKKVVQADPRVSVAVETLLALPVAGGYLIVLEVLGRGHFITENSWHPVLMVLSGVVTAVPLLLFAAAAQRLPMVTLGLLFYLNPAMQMVWGVFIGHEPMPVGRWIGFALIWTALAVMTFGTLRVRRTDVVADTPQTQPATPS